MDQEMAASIPLPASAAATPFSSPPSLPQKRWLKGELHASPNSSPVPEPLSAIEVVPPTPPRRSRRQVPMTPIEDDDGSLAASPSRQSIVGTPGRRTRMMNRMSGAFHAGTPPPATRMLHPDDAKARHAPISNTFLRDGKRSSIVSNLPSSRRHSVVSAHRDAPWDQNRDLDEAPEAEEEDYNEQYHAQRPGIQHRETTSDETYVSPPTTSDGNWRTSSSTNHTLAKAMRVDPLTALERRRRRDYTLGSHHPLHGPPNTPLQPNRRLSNVTDESEEEVPNVEWSDIVDRFRTVWRRFGDMPWLAEPCVAKLVIPHPPKAPGEKSVEPTAVSWYRPKPTLDEILADEAGQVEREGDGDNDSTTLAHYGPVTNNTSTPKQSKWFPRMPQSSHQPGRERFGDALVVRGIVRR